MIQKDRINLSHNGFLEITIIVNKIGTIVKKPIISIRCIPNNNGENSIGVASGSNYDLSPAHLDKAIDSIISADVVLTQLETPINTVEYLAKIISTQTSTFILNPAPAHPLSDELLQNLDVITPNETEAEQLTGLKVTNAESAQSSCNKLHDLGVQTVIITMGRKFRCCIL